MGKETITFAGDTTGALDDDNARSLDAIWYLSAGSNYTSGTLQTSWGTKVDANRAVGQVNFADSTSNNFYLTGCQLETGSASDFEFLPVDVNLQRCKRYLFITDGRYYLNGQGGTNSKYCKFSSCSSTRIKSSTNSYKKHIIKW